MRLDSRLQRLERQRPERAVIFLWGDDPAPADADKDTLIIRFVWDDSKAAPGARQSGKKRARRLRGLTGGIYTCQI